MKKMSHWYKIMEISEGVYMIEETDHVNSFLINGEEKSILIDTGMGLADLKKAIIPYSRNEITVLNTHWHFDHIGSNHQFENVGISLKEKWLVEKNVPNEILKGALTEPFPDNFNPDTYYIRGSKAAFTIDDGDIFDLGSRQLEVIATPGHSEGSMSFLDSKTGILFSGDLLLKGDFLHIQYTESSIDDYIESLEKLEGRIKDIKTIFPSHGEVPIPVEYISKTCNVLMKIKAGDKRFVEGVSFGTPILFYDVDGIQVYLKKPGTMGVASREMVK